MVVESVAASFDHVFTRCCEWGRGRYTCCTCLHPQMPRRQIDSLTVNGTPPDLFAVQSHVRQHIRLRWVT